MIATKRQESAKTRTETPPEHRWANDHPVKASLLQTNPLWQKIASRTSALAVQAKLRIGAPDDEYEREADRLAEQVMRMPNPHVRTGPVQAKNDEEMPAPPIVNEVLRSPGRQLDPATQEFFEQRFGHDFGQVRVHAGTLATAAAQAISARAFTVGECVVFGHGQYSPQSSEGSRLLAHELVHTVQQGVAGQRPSGSFERSVVFGNTEDQRTPVDVDQLPDRGLEQPQLGRAIVQREEARPSARPERVATPAREQAARALDSAIENLREAIPCTERGDPIPEVTRHALARFFPGEGQEFLPLLLQRILAVRRIIETVRIRSVFHPVDASIEPGGWEINLLLAQGSHPQAWPIDSPNHILVFPRFYREDQFQATQLIHECFHLHYSFIRHSIRAPGHENPRANAYSYQGFVSILGGLAQDLPLQYFPEPAAGS